MTAEGRSALFHLFFFPAQTPTDAMRRLRLVGNGTGAQKRPDASHVSGGQTIHVGR
jgi:hypothetical protein